MNTGWFGRPGRIGGKTHLAVANKPYCGIALHPKSIFQWTCSWAAVHSVECKRCKAKYHKEFADLAKEKKE